MANEESEIITESYNAKPSRSYHYYLTNKDLTHMGKAKNSSSRGADKRVHTHTNTRLQANKTYVNRLVSTPKDRLIEEWNKKKTTRPTYHKITVCYSFSIYEAALVVGIEYFSGLFYW